MTEAPGIDMQETDTDGDGLIGDGPVECALKDGTAIQDGVVQWCAATYNVAVNFDFNDVIGGSEPQTLSIQAQSQSDSTYDKPLVAACCTDVTDVPGWAPGDETCALPHHKACYSDLVEQVCNAIPAALGDFAHDNFLNGQNIIEEAEDWFKNNRQDCYDHFWIGSDNFQGADYCSFDGAYYDHPAWEPGQTWTNSTAGTSIGNFSIALSSQLAFEAIVTNHQEPLESCNGPVDNNGVLPPFSELDPTTVKGFATGAVGIDVSGPKWNDEVISGSARASTESWVGFRPGAVELTLDGWSMVEAATTDVGTSTVSGKVRNFEIRLLGQQVVPEQGRYFVLPSGGGLFALGGVVDEESDYVTTTNSTAIEFYLRRPGSKGCPSTTESCLVNKPFRLTYEDLLGQTWEVDVASTTWAP